MSPYIAIVAGETSGNLLGIHLVGKFLSSDKQQARRLLKIPHKNTS